jgi:hypothetical protein
MLRLDVPDELRGVLGTDQSLTWLFGGGGGSAN